MKPEQNNNAKTMTVDIVMKANTTNTETKPQSDKNPFVNPPLT